MSWKIWRPSELSPARIVAFYLVVSWLWIISSDSVLHALVNDPNLEASLQTIKGSLFVAVTALLLYLLSKRMIANLKHEVAERGQVEIELRKLSQAVEQSPVSVIITDTDGVIEYVNPKFTEVTGYAPAEVVGQNPRILKSGENPPDLYEQLWKCLDSGRDWHGELHNRRKNGELFWESATIGPIKGPDGTVTHYLAVKEDITEQRRTRDQLVQSAKLATLGEMATGLAHELNQPLNVVRMVAESSMELIEDGELDADFLHGKLERIRAQTVRAAEIIDHMRIFGRTDNGTPKPVDPSEAVRAALDLMKEQLRLREIDVETRFPTQPRKIMGHAVRLEQVVLNLIGNARDAIETKGAFGLEQRKISLIVEDAGLPNQIKLIVRDSGGGIPEHAITRIFEPFFTTKEVGKGTGLGLSISYGIVADMGGAIEAANFGDGAEITITLPALDEQARAA